MEFGIDKKELTPTLIWTEAHENKYIEHLWDVMDRSMRRFTYCISLTKLCKGSFAFLLLLSGPIRGVGRVQYSWLTNTTISW